MKASSGLGRSRARRVVYVNSFGGHRSGNVIRYSGGGDPLRYQEAASCLSGSRGAAGLPPGKQRSPCFGLKAAGEARAKGVGRGRKEGGEAKRSLPREGRSSKAAAAEAPASDSQEEEGGCKETEEAFEFPSSWEADNSEIRHQKKKSTVWLGVCKVISKMIEENGHFRSRLLSFSELQSDGRDVHGNVQNETSCIDTDEAIFGWV